MQVWGMAAAAAVVATTGLLAPGHPHAKSPAVLCRSLWVQRRLIDQWLAWAGMVMARSLRQEKFCACFRQCAVWEWSLLSQ